MELIIVLAIAIASAFVGIAIGWFLRFIIALGQRGSMELEIKEMMLTAREEADQIKNEAQEEAEKILKESKDEIKKEEERLQKTEDRLINKEGFLDKRQLDLDSEAENLKEKESEMVLQKEQLQKVIEEKSLQLQKVSGLSKDQAKEILLEEIEKEYEEDLKIRAQKLETSNKEKLDKKAREIITSAIQRLAMSIPSDVFTTNIDLPSDEIKGKVRQVMR